MDDYLLFSSRSKDMRILYGAPPELPLDPNIVEGPTLEEAIENAGRNCIKYKDKGFISNIPDGATPASIYAREYRAITAKRHKKEEQTFKEVTLKDMDDCIRPLFTYKPVKDITREINRFPFYDQMKKDEAVRKFQNSVIKLLNQMKNKKMINNDIRHSPPLKVIQYYQDELAKIRKELIKSCLDNNLIDKSKCKATEKLAAAYPEHFITKKNLLKKQKMEKSLDAEINRSLAIDLSNITQDLPPSYQFDTHMISEEEKTEFSRNAIETFNKTLESIELNLPPCFHTVPVSPREKSEAMRKANIAPSFSPLSMALAKQKHILRPNTRTVSPKKIFPTSIMGSPLVSKTKPINKLRSKTNLWKLTDPMQNARDGKFVDPLQVISDIPKKLDEDIDNELKKKSAVIEAPIPSVLYVDPKELNKETPKPVEEHKEKVLNMAPVVTESDKRKKEEEEHKLAKESIETMLKKPEFEATKTSTMKEALEIISNFQVNEKSGDTPTDKLQIVWHELGLTPQQKLAFLVKYTMNSDESFKLHDSYTQWEQALAFAKQYHSAYKSIKDFLTYEYGGFAHQKSLFDSLMKSFELAEDNLLQAEKSLKDQYGDELIVHRRRASDLVIQRKEKLSNLMAQHNIQNV